MQVSVVIANKNGERFIKNCLGSILRERGNYEVVVVDDGSTDRSVEYLDRVEKKTSRLRVIRLPRNVGAAEARNIGVKNTTGKYILFLDVDTIIKSGWYREVLSFFRRNKGAGAAQVKLLTMGSKRYDSAGELMGPFGFLIERARGASDKGQFDEEVKIFSGKSAGMIVRREVFENLSGFDRDYKVFLEDTDLFWRVWLSGWEVRFAPRVVVEHAFWTKLKPFKHYIDNRVFYRGARNTITNLVKNLGKERWWVVVVNVFLWLVLGVVFCLRLDFKKGWAMFSGVGWNVFFIFKVLKKRRRVQETRKILDEDLFKMVGGRRSLSYYFNKAKAYVGGRSY
jgi:GT2 family glycosyltransferase